MPAATTCITNTYLLRTGLKQASHFTCQSANTFSHSWSQQHSELKQERRSWSPEQILQASWLWRCQGQSPKRWGCLRYHVQEPCWEGSTLQELRWRQSPFWHSHIQPSSDLEQPDKAESKQRKVWQRFSTKQELENWLLHLRLKMADCICSLLLPTQPQAVKSTLF